MHPRIILIRHGECHGNRDLEQFAAVPDYTIELTERGVEQAREAGRRLKEVVEDETLYFYVSPLFIMRWFHLTVEEFESMKPPHNAEPIVMEYNPSTSLYELKTPLETDPEAVIRSRPIRL